MKKKPIHYISEAVLLKMAFLRMEGYNYAYIARQFRTSRQRVRDRLKDLAKSQKIKFPDIALSRYQRIRRELQKVYKEI